MRAVVTNAVRIIKGGCAASSLRGRKIRLADDKIGSRSVCNGYGIEMQYPMIIVVCNEKSAAGSIDSGDIISEVRTCTIRFACDHIRLADDDIRRCTVGYGQGVENQNTVIISVADEEFAVIDVQAFEPTQSIRTQSP